jgi:hypothetical protein
VKEQQKWGKKESFRASKSKATEEGKGKGKGAGKIKGLPDTPLSSPSAPSRMAAWKLASVFSG